MGKKRVTIADLQAKISHLEGVVTGQTAKIANLEQTNANLEADIKDAKADNHGLGEELNESNNQAHTARFSLEGARSALELVVAILAQNNSPNTLAATFPETAKEFGIKANGYHQRELLNAMTRAYSKAPERAVMAITAAELAAMAKKVKEKLAGEARGRSSIIEELLGSLGGHRSFDPNNVSDPLGSMLEDLGLPADMFGGDPVQGRTKCTDPTCRGC